MNRKSHEGVRRRVGRGLISRLISIRMKYALSFFLLTLSGENWAQLRVNNCSFGGPNGEWISTSIFYPFMDGPGTYTSNRGPIEHLEERSVFEITGTGPGNHYIIDASIYQRSFHSGVLTLLARGDNWGGQNAGLILKGVSSNGYRGATIIKGGFIACNKPVDVVAIQGDIKLVTTTSGLEAGLWFGANGQLSGDGVLIFETSNANAIVSLNGTTQRLWGINAGGVNAIFENIEPENPTNISGIPQNRRKATLILTGTTGRYTIGKDAAFRAGGPAGYNEGLDVLVRGTSQVIQDPAANINNVNFIGQPGGSLELNTSTAQVFTTDASIGFTGTGRIVKTGPGELQAHKFRSGGDVQVRAGNLILKGTSRLGDGLPYMGIASIASGTILDHNNNETTDFRGDITGAGLLRCTGSGTVLISGNKKTFTGNVLVTGSEFFGGNGDISNAVFNLTAGGKMGGGEGQDARGGNLIVGNLTLESKTSVLVVTSMSATDNTPSLVEAKVRGTGDPGSVTIREGNFTIDLVATRLVSGYVLKCTNGRNNPQPPFPTLRTNNTGKRPYFRWDDQGLYMAIGGGLICDNCTFRISGISMTGTIAKPGVILGAPGTYGDMIILNGNGPCNFTVMGTGNYTLSGPIRGTGPVTYRAPDIGSASTTAGITLRGVNNNVYEGVTTIDGGYIICSKRNAVAIPNGIRASAPSGVQTEIWCQSDNQFGTGTVIDFRDAQSYSYLHLNGTTQTVAGLKANNGIAVVQSNESGYFPVGMTDEQLSSSPAVLNIAAAANNTCTFGGGAYIRKGGGKSLSFTVNVTGGTQVIQDPTGNINNVTLASAQGATLEFNSSTGNTYLFGTGVTFQGAGLIKKTGEGAIGTNNSTVLKTEPGQILAADGVFRNDMTFNVYSGNTAILQVDAPNGSNHNPTFDLWGNNSVFGGLRGGGWVQNNWGVSGSPQGGYNNLTLGENSLQNYSVFEGIIRDNSTNGPVSGGDFGTGGIALRKVGTGTQVLKGDNRYTGSTTVSSGTLQLQGNGQLGNATTAGTYNGAIEISNATGTQAIFEHKGDKTQVFNGNITSTGSGSSGLFLQSGTGETIINGTSVKDFTGDINITAGFLGGSGNLSKAGNLYVGASGSIGGGYGLDDQGATLTIASLNFLAPASKLIVASASATDATPSLLDVRNGSGQATINAANRFTVDLVADNLKSGYLIKCTNGVSGGFLLPTLGRNNTGKKPTFRWDDQGLYMGLGEGLTCDNCSFVSGTATITGTTASPAVILAFPGTFPGNITLNGTCNFTAKGTGDYRLSGVISGNGPLIYNAPDAGSEGHSAGITLEGDNANTYTGQTTLTGGYVICNKPNGVAAIPALPQPGTTIKISATSAGVSAHLWCQKDNQLGTGAIIDFSDAQTYSYSHLNGTTQTVAGLQSNNGHAVVENNWDNTFLPVGLTAGQLSTSPATLNIAAGSTTYTFGEGGYIRNGTSGSPALTVNVTVGRQIIQNPTGHISNVTLASAQGATLEFNSSTGNTYLFGTGVTFQGAGLIKKTGEGAIGTNNSTVLKTEPGQILAADGVFRNDMMFNVYSGNTAILQVDAPNGSNHNPTFDLWGNNSVFGGLRGGGWVQNNWGVSGSPQGGYNDLTLGENSLQNYSVFEGVLRDNSTNGPVSAGDFGTGGIALRKVGTGTQVLKGDNRYTGSTTVSSGTLQLQGNGQLGNATTAGIYNGVLEISNSAGTQAIFEHKGDKTQVFNGNISSTGTGTLGTYLQSGSGQTIIEGAKSFAGNVSVTAGFLGGSGDISNANRVTLEEGGNIGGGNGEMTGGATFTVSNLTFAEGSRLKVTSRADNTPALVDVRTMGTSTTGSGSVTAGNGFTVDVLGGTDLVSGYIMYCTGGTSLPVPTLGKNNTEKQVCFKWDNTGLWMQFDLGNITLTSTSICLAVNPVNLVVTVTAAYSAPHDYPSSGTTVDFSLSDPSVKSGDMTITRVLSNLTITAAFNGVNQTTSDKFYTITYNDHHNCPVRIVATINPQPVLRISSGNNSACKGTPVVLQATGAGRLTILSADINTPVVSITSSVGLATAGTTPLGNVKFFATDGNGCRSKYLSVSVKDLPVMNTILNQSVCNAAQVPDYTPSSPGAGETKPTHYQWKVTANAVNHDNVGLSDYTLDWSKPAISGFKAGNTTTGILKCDVTVSAYNSETGCTSSAPQIYTITVNPGPVIANAIDLSQLCSGVNYANALSGGEGSWSVYKTGTTEAGLSKVTASTTQGSSLQAGTVSVLTVEDLVLTSNTTSCKSNVTLTINPNPVISANGINLSQLCSGVNYADALSGGEGSWSVYKTGTTEAGLSKVTGSTTPGSNLQAGSVSVLTVEDVVLTNAASCKSNVLTLTINPNPVISANGINVSQLCSGVSYSNALSGGEGSWSVYKTGTTEVGLSGVSGSATPGRANLQAGSVSVLTVEDVVLTNAASCKSNALTLTINPNPVISANGINVSQLCSGVSYSNALSGGEGSWSVYKTGTTEAGLSKVTSSTTPGSNLQAGSVSVLTVEDVVLTNAASCKSNVLTLTINPNPVISANGINVSQLCSGVSYSNALSGGEGSWSVYKTGTTEVGLSGVSCSATPGRANLQAGSVSVLTVEDVVLTNAASCKSNALTLTINPNPVISANGINVSQLCSGVNYADALSGGEGSWSVYKTGTAEAGLSSVSASTTLGRATLQAGTVTAVTLEDVVLTSNAASCKSKLTLTIYPKPVMNLIPNLTTCSNRQVPAYTPVSPAGVPEEAKTTHYKWKAEAVNPTDVGLPDYTTDWSKTAISQFTAVNPTSVLKREVTVSAYNSTSGCQAEPQVYTITINPGLTVTYTATSPICNRTETDVVLRSSLSPAAYTWTAGNNSVGAQSQTTASGTSFIRQTLTNRGSSPETVTYKVTGTSGHCSDTVSIAVKVSNAALAKPTVESEDGWHHCVASEHGTYQTRLIPSVPGTNNVEWTYTSYYGNGQVAASLTGNTQKAERDTLTAVTDNLVLSHTSSASVYYVFHPYSAGCFGTPSDPVGIRLYAAPVVAAIPPQEVCSSSEAYPTAINIALSSSTPDVVYTWTVDRINGRDVTGYSELSGEGARVPTQNPSQARSGPIADVLSLPANAATQTLDYWVTPWLFGCPGQAVLGRVKVNSPPAITAPADREHCLGDAAIRVAAEPLKGTAAAFTWTGGVKAGLADQTVYGPGLPAYRVAATTTSLALKVTISGKNDKGCKGSTSFNIAVNSKPSITLGNPQILCTGPTIETAAQTNIGVSYPIAGTKYKWTASFVDFRPDGKSEVKLVNGNNELLALPVRESPREEGNFIRKIIATTDSYAQVTFRLTPFLGNCAGEGKDTDVIVKGVNLLTGVANNSPDVCSGGTTNIKIGKEGDGNTYSWEGINNSGSVLGYTPSQESGATTISDILTLSNNKRDSIIYHITPSRRFTNGDGGEYYCMGKPVSSTVFVNPIPVLSLSPATASICSGESTAISYSINLEQPESNNVYYSWEVTPNKLGARSSSGLQKSIPQQVLTSDNAESSVTYTITPQYKPAAGGTCKGQPAASTYRVNASARASISSVPESVCLGDKVTLKTDSKGTNFQWLKNGKTIPGATGESYVVPTDSLSVSSYAVAITAGCGNSTSEARKVKVSADAYFTGGSAATDKATAAMAEAVKFSYTGPKADYLWDFNDNTFMPDTESVTHSYTKPGTYYPTLKATKQGQPACTKTFSFSLEIRSVNPTIVVGYGVFPIPARDKLTISSNEEEDLQNITLSDMIGKLVLNEAVKGHNVTLSVTHIAQGIYLLSITNTKGEVKRLEIAKE